VDVEQDHVRVQRVDLRDGGGDVASLADNLDGLRWLLPQLDGKPAPPKPKYRTWKEEKK